MSITIYAALHFLQRHYTARRILFHNKQPASRRTLSPLLRLYLAHLKTHTFHIHSLAPCNQGSATDL